MNALLIANFNCRLATGDWLRSQYHPRERMG